MTASLTVLLLGSPELAVGGMPVGVRSAKARALLCYLATTTAPRSRAELAALLWGERPDANAKGSLRLALSELRREVGGWLDITREQVRLRAADGCFVDRRHLAQAPTVAEALRLWRGNFMDGVSFCDAPAFAEWLEGERRGVRLLLRQVLMGARDEPAEQVTRLAYIVAGLDPYDEEAHRLLMTALARAGNRAGALACYDELRRRLTAELGIEPAPETRAVRLQLAARPPAPALRARVPAPGTELVGRDADIRRLRALLGRERLVTLVGPGGIGKTRLAIAASTPPAPTSADPGNATASRPGSAASREPGGDAQREPGGDAQRGPEWAAQRGPEWAAQRGPEWAAQRGPEWAAPGGAASGAVGGWEAAFVSFAGVRPEAAVTTLARRLDVDLSPPRPALGLLMDALTTRPHPLLLVLDNLEHLPAFDQVIGAMLTAAPELRILATSRRRLDLPGQVTVTVEGLRAPASEALFAARAAQACPAFDPDREAALVAAICAATGGLPLAIELAAGLLRAVPCAELARHLGAGLGLLSVAGPAARSRHACMRTVFETSWRLLDPAGQRTLTALSVFGGGCTLDAAVEVAGATPDVLVRLVDHSMIRLAPSGRYAVHPLIQQYAAAHLSPEERRAARRRHAAYFGRLLEQHAGALQDASDAAATDALGVEMDNVRTAWAASGRPRFLELYWTLCLRLRLYEESAAVVRRHLARTSQDARLRARHLWMAGTSEHHLAREHEAARLARAALEALGEPLPESRRGLAAASLAAAARQAVRLLAATARQAAHRLLPPGPSRNGREPAHRSPRPRSPGSSPDGREAAQALTMLARLAFHQHDVLTMLAASLRQLNAAERTGDAALRAEAYANAATIARVAGRHRLATRYGTLADRSLADVDHAAEPASRAQLARGLDQLYAGAFEAAWRSFTECRARTLAPRVAENCSGLLAETALCQGRFERAAELFAATAEVAARRVGGDDIGRHWCLIGQAEAMLRLDAVPVARIGAVLSAARTSHERRRTHEKELGLCDGPVLPTIQEMRLITATARLTLRERQASGTALGRGVAGEDPREVLATALTLAGRLPAAQRGMLECWTGLAELLWSLDPWPDRKSIRLLHTHLARYATRNPGAAARLGWARALVLTAAGKRAAAREAAEQALATATRLATPYDRRRAEEIIQYLGS
ncbi:hypothetical protein FXF51_35210 [Nonomuraea sp. PA05]|uniref:ATP-binding protein n=1 Tax=Nonomuraea sp. PA05 TaxID=2604466 RepID=UPI0011D9E581|nr:BTAD domain-containing putative transcriptional regulator [Nonomuraea sp. PA05]TYB59221.1 hypothetical protein FXF51_35210 [Nonomuraea sp. PA05]